MNWYENIISCLDFKDIAKLFEKTSYELTSYEIAWLIHHANWLTIAQKHTALKKLMNEMPDCKISKEVSGIYHPNLYKLLDDYIAIEKRAIKDFYIPKEGSVYLAEVKLSAGEWVGMGTAFTELKKCLDLVENTFKSFEEIHVDKIYLNKAIMHPSAIFNSQRELIGIYGFEMSDEEREVISFLNSETIGNMLITEKNEV